MEKVRTVIQQVQCKEELWKIDEEVPAAGLSAWMDSEDVLLCLRFGEPPYRVVLGAPHHTALGQNRLCERRLDKNGKQFSRPADENSASFGLVAFSRLVEQNVPCKLVVMAHDTHVDPNKEETSAYFVEIFSEPARLLLECHGMSHKRRLDLEVSAGCNRLTRPLDFARWLAADLQWPTPLGAQIRPGSKDALLLYSDRPAEPGVLERPALLTASLNKANHYQTHALHLETRPGFRRPLDGGAPITPAGRKLGRAIATAIPLYLNGLEGR